MSDLSPADLIEGRRLLSPPGIPGSQDRAKLLDWLVSHTPTLLYLAERAEKAEAECKRLMEENARLSKQATELSNMFALALKLA